MIRIYSGADGETHAEETRVALGAPRAGAAFSDALKADNIRFMTRSGPSVEEWHAAPRRQYAITISGKAEIEIGGGKRVPLVPGGVLLIEDTKGKGHRVHVLTAEGWTAAFVPLAEVAK